MSIPHVGAAAALGTVVCWTASAMLFEKASHKIGSLSVNFIRLVLAFMFMAVVLTLLRGTPVPTDFPAKAWGWLMLSGLIGFCFGDMCLFRAFVEIGARITMLVMSFVPILTALIGWALLGETYGLAQCLGMSMTVAGIAWVITCRHDMDHDEKEGPARVRRHATPKGVLLAIGGTVGQALGIVTAKQGMGQLNPIAATQIRIIAGTLGFAAIFCFIRWWPNVFRSLRHKKAMAYTTGGAIVGPALGVTLLMLALHYAPSGVVATITALVPLVMIPIVILVDKEHVPKQAIYGSLLAVGGVVLLVS
jgi:drug/metabolite transporter (DMT)-like permease